MIMIVKKMIPPLACGSREVVFSNGPYITGSGPTNRPGSEGSVAQYGDGLQVEGWYAMPPYSIATEFKLDATTIVKGFEFSVIEVLNTLNYTFTDLVWRLYKTAPNLSAPIQQASGLDLVCFTDAYRFYDYQTTYTSFPIFLVQVMADKAFTLQPGTYWLEWQVSKPNPFLFEILQMPITVLGQFNTGKGLNYNANTNAWTPTLDCDGDCPQGFPFRLIGRFLRFRHRNMIVKTDCDQVRVEFDKYNHVKFEPPSGTCFPIGIHRVTMRQLEGEESVTHFTVKVEKNC